MIDQSLAEKIKKYVMERLCRCGGFCFYKLEEPNGADTFYALSILNLLDVEFYDENTVKLLQSMQRKDGSYSSLYSAYYSIKGLELLGEEPKYECRKFLRRNLKIYATKNLPAGLQSIFRQMYYLVDLYKDIGMAVDEDKRRSLINFILSFKNKDYGFGKEKSTLIETFHAVFILHHLDHNTQDSLNFLKMCENRFYGFVNIPYTSPSFIEHLYAGLELSKFFGYIPSFPDSIRDFIINCQNKNGGFSRSPTGLANLENTYYAVKSLHILDKLCPELL